ncbi:iron/manganese transporter [candidate division KSB1 bacterium]|nr:MAG: iron/manganese transporter [candidate division KSB1 bacterium]
MSNDHSNASLSEVHRSVKIPDKIGFVRRLLAFVGPAYLVSVGYMDPGNWATDIEGGSRFGYELLWVLLMSNAMAVLLQTLCARLGIVTRMDLAQACRHSYSRPLGFVLWILCEIAITACDLAEVLGTAIGLNLLFGIPLLAGVLITAVDVLLLLYFQHLGIRKVEAFILALITVIGGCFVIEVFLAKPDWTSVASGFIPRLSNESLYIAIGILGATVMPHNLYLHSALVQTRAIGRTKEKIAQACKYNFIDSGIALNAAFFVNAAILIVSAAVFHSRGEIVTEIQQAHDLLTPLLGTSIAATAFGLALLCSGQSSTLTGTLAGQVVMEGFLRFNLRPWVRRLITRSLAIVPAAIVIAISGAEGTYKLLILSQVILSFQLPFAVVPLIHFTSDKRKMGEFANPLWVKILAWVVAAIVIGLNVRLVYGALTEWIANAGGSAVWIGAFVIPLMAALAGLLLYLVVGPFLRGLKQAAEEKAPAFTPAELQAPEFAKIGVGLEATKRDRAILAQAVSLAKLHNAELILIHVAEGMGPRFWKSESLDEEVRSDRDYLETLQRQVQEQGIKADFRLGFGEPADELVQIARESNLNLLVLGTHGHRFPKDMLFGATATRVRHRLKIPVFMVRTDDETK